MATLEVSNLVVRYGQVTAVHGIDLRLEEGQVATLLGSNGAGKTSTPTTATSTPSKASR
jgi:branched-chain amino acid transport system ATP-binding protein